MVNIATHSNTLLHVAYNFAMCWIESCNVWNTMTVNKRAIIGFLPKGCSSSVVEEQNTKEDSFRFWVKKRLSSFPNWKRNRAFEMCATIMQTVYKRTWKEKCTWEMFPTKMQNVHVQARRKTPWVKDGGAFVPLWVQDANVGKEKRWTLKMQKESQALHENAQRFTSSEVAEKSRSLSRDPERASVTIWGANTRLIVCSPNSKLGETLQWKKWFMQKKPSWNFKTYVWLSQTRQCLFILKVLVSFNTFIIYHGRFSRDDKSHQNSQTNWHW